MSETQITTENNLLRVTLYLAHEFTSKSQDSLHTEMQAKVQVLLNDLGIPGVAAIEITFAENHRDSLLTISVNDCECHYPEELLRDTCSYVKSDLSVQAVTAEQLQQLSDEQLQLFLSLAITSILKIKPALLFSAQAADAYRTALLQQTAEALPEVAELHTILSAVLNLRISIGDKATVNKALTEMTTNTLSPADKAEYLIARLRPRSAEIRLPSAYLQQLTADADVDDKHNFKLMREGLWYELGIELPEFQFVADETLLPDSFVFTLNHLTTLPRKGLRADQCLVGDTPDRLQLFNVDGEFALNPANRKVCAVVAASRREGLKDDYQTWSQTGYLILALSGELRTQAAACIDRNTVSTQLDLLKQSCARLAADAQVIYSIELLTQTFRQLLAEEISLRNMRRILQALIDCDYVVTDETKLIVFDPRLTTPDDPPADWLHSPVNLAAAIRTNLKQYISHKYTRGQSTLVVYLLDQQIEKSLVAETNEQTMNPVTAQRILAAVREELNTLPPAATIPAILTTTGARSALRKILADVFPRLPILAYQELSPDMNIQRLARITFPANQVGEAQ